MSRIKSNYTETPNADELKDTIANRIKELRIGRKLMQKDIASIAGINTFTYSGYENARVLPPIDILLRIAEVHKVSLDFLTGRVDTVQTMVGDCFEPKDESLEARVMRIENTLRENGIDSFE